MAELEHLSPAKAKEMFLAQRKDEVAEKTHQIYHYRLKPFIKWCEQEDVTNLNDLTARSLHEYRPWRKGDGDLKTITLKGQLSTLRVFVKFLESIDGVEQGLHDKMLIPSVEDEEAVSNSILEAERAEQVLDYLGKYEYASKRHALLTVLWHTGCRMGAAHSLDVSDFDTEEQSLAIRHRPDTETNLKNKQSGERICALSEDVCEVLQDDYLPKRQTFTFTGQQKPMSEQEFDGGQVDATPEQVRRTIRAYVKTDSKDVDGEALRLWQGSDEGRPSASETDMAFVKQLYYWCKGDQQLMDECFRASQRIRPKRDEYRGGQTYGEMTISKVCRTNSETFGGRYVEYPPHRMIFYNCSKLMIYGSGKRCLSILWERDTSYCSECKYRNK